MTKQFQYAGTDDFDEVLDVQINEFLVKEGLTEDSIVDIKYEGHAALGVNTYSALIIYKSND